MKKLNIRQKSAIMILFIILKHQLLIPKENWVFFSLKEEGSTYEKYLDYLSKEMEFSELSIHLREVGKISYWLYKFNLYLCDNSMNNPDLREHLGSSDYYGNDGLLLNYQLKKYTILKTVDEYINGADID